jgi:hypothetical protein
VSEPATPIVLVAGAVKEADRPGHHDYRAGCALLTDLLGQTPGVAAVTVHDGWPADDAVFAGARAVVSYTAGRDNDALLAAARLAVVQRAVDASVGLVTIHQAVRYPVELADRAVTWIGGVHVRGESRRGHWPTSHRKFPVHPVTNGVAPWTIVDGWLNGIRFVDGLRGITPLVWASREYGGSDAGGAGSIVAWTYDRPGGGRSFCFTGLDAHSAWSHPGVRQLVVNGILWAAGVTVPPSGAPCAVDAPTLHGYLTPRTSPRLRPFRRLLRRLRRRRDAQLG